MENLFKNFVFKELHKPAPDTIYLNWKQDQKIQELWSKSAGSVPHEMIVGNTYLKSLNCAKNIDGTGTIPSDIFFANTIPLLDCAIEVDERDIPVCDLLDQPDINIMKAKQIELNGYGQLVKFRVIIEENYKEIIQGMSDNPKYIGFLYVDSFIRILQPLYVARGVNAIISCSCIVQLNDNYAVKSFIPTDSDLGEYLAWYFHSFLATWYSIQISLLNPRIKCVFAHPTMIKNRRYQKAVNDNERRRTAKYIKRYYLNDDELDEALYGKEKGNINRKCLVWYVIGHWRNYKDGKQVFIQPYWKGALREIKQNLDERNRIIDEESY